MKGKLKVFGSSILFNCRETGSSSESFYGKRIKLSDPDSISKNVIVAHQRLPMQAKENVENIKIEDDSDDDGCCVIAENPRRKTVGSTLNIQAELLIDENFKCKENLRIVSYDKDEDKDINSQRSCLTQSKVLKSKLEYRNHIKKKINCLEECYRLTEKLQYIKLLQSQASCLVSKNQNKITHLPSSSTIPVIDLTNEKTNYSQERNKTLISPITTDSGDEEIQIIKEIQGVKSFDEALKIGSRSKEFLEKKQALVPYSTALKKNEPTSSRKMRDDRFINLLDNNNKTPVVESLEVKLHNLMQISDHRVDEDEIKYEKYSLPKLTPEHEKLIQAALKVEPKDEILTEGFGLRITRRDMQTLGRLNWLNDEVINFYMNLIMDRCKSNAALPKVYAFNTFFYPKLVSSGYQSLKRWTKNVDIFSCDIILVPIHLGMHWCLSVIDFRTKFIKYFDSVGSPNDSCLEYLFKYLKYEYLDKKREFFDTEGWVLANVEDTPQQMNGSDCGVFSCMFAEYQSRDAEISFTQDEMPYFRKKIVIELLEKKLLT